MSPTSDAQGFLCLPITINTCYLLLSTQPPQRAQNCGSDLRSLLSSSGHHVLYFVSAHFFSGETSTHLIFNQTVLLLLNHKGADTLCLICDWIIRFPIRCNMFSQHKKEKSHLMYKHFQFSWNSTHLCFIFLSVLLVSYVRSPVMETVSLIWFLYYLYV